MRLRVLTLNVWGLPLGLARHQEARIRAVGERFKTADDDSAPHVIALQEVWTRGARETLTQAGRSAGYTAIWHREAAFGGSGLLVLSRLPIRHAHFTPYRLAGLPQRIQHSDFYGGKGFASLELETPVGPIALINSHLHANYSPRNEADEYIGIRASQAIEIAAHIRSLETPVVAVGDFNSREDETAYRILLGLSGLRDLAAELDRRQDTCTAPHPYRPVGAESQRIDLVLAGRGRALSARGLGIQRVYDEKLQFAGELGSYSDHAGLLAEIEFAPDPLPNPSPTRPAPEPNVFERARAELEAGRRIALQRGRREARATGAAALLTGGVAWRARRNRRHFLSTLTFWLAALAAGGGLGLLFASRRVVAAELEGYGEIEELIATLSRELRTEPSQPVRIDRS